MTENSKMIKLASGVIVAVSLVFAIVSYFLLPEKIFVQLFESSNIPETKTSVFLIAGVLIIGLASVKCFLTDNGKKWIALQSVIAIAFSGCLIYNIIVL